MVLHEKEYLEENRTSEHVKKSKKRKGKKEKKAIVFLNLTNQLSRPSRAMQLTQEKKPFDFVFSAGLIT